MKTVMMVVLAAMLLAACAPGGAAPDNGAAAVKSVETYLQAKIKGDEAGLRALLCAAKEKDLSLEATTFLGTNGVVIQDMACQFDGTGKVTCTGKIVADYGQEKNEFPLGAYKVVQEDGEWKYCGETQ